MPANYVLLQRIELNASAASVTFSNIPQSGYTDLKIVGSTRQSGNADGFQMGITFNGSSSGYSRRVLLGDGVSAQSYSGSSESYTRIAFAESSTYTANTFNNFEIYIPNYTSSNNKSFSSDAVTENNATTSYASLNAGLWSNTAAITSITLSEYSGSGTSFVANSTFSLYGLAAVGTTPVIAPKATGGNITSDGTYWIHTFNSTGTFTPLQGLSCDALVVAGGGGGASYGAGGGGGGGFRTTTGLSVSTQAYTITVGAGGNGGAGGAGNDGTKGNDSVFSTITATGGGFGGEAQIGGSGGSGGGAGGQFAGGAGNTPSTSPSQGNNGGSGWGAGGIYGSGGGGGAGATGGNGSASVAGNGGNGATNSYSGTSVTYAGGGGGGAYQWGGTATGGTGGGGNAGAGGGNNNGQAGTANTGGGGGGSHWQTAGTASGGAGGSGIVIIRYPIA